MSKEKCLGLALCVTAVLAGCGGDDEPEQHKVPVSPPKIEKKVETLRRKVEISRDHSVAVVKIYKKEDFETIIYGPYVLQCIDKATIMDSGVGDNTSDFEIVPGDICKDGRIEDSEVSPLR